MDEYISREETLKAFRLTAKNPNKDYQRGMQDTIDCLVPEVIADIPSADVQPVNRWISVEDRLPESRKEVLVWYRYTWGDGSTSYGFGINRWYSNAKQWRDGCLLKGVEVLYWQSLPEPPKDGDVDPNTRNLTDEETDIYNSWLEAEAETIDEISLL